MPFDEHDGTSLHAVVAYDPEWVVRFQQVADVLRDRVPGVISVHHIGSTAVSGLSGRDIVDLELVVDPTLPESALAAALQVAGYARFDPPDLAADGVRLFLPDDPGTRVHVHVHPQGSDHVKRHLAVRNYLRAEQRALAWAGRGPLSTDE